MQITSTHLGGNGGDPKCSLGLQVARNLVAGILPAEMEMFILSPTAAGCRQDIAF